MSFTRVPVQLWMQLDRPTRELLAKAFVLKKTGITEVRDQEVLTDGFSNEDLAAITAEKMEAYVGSHETFPRLWELSCARARSILNPIEIELTKVEVTPEEAEVTSEEAEVTQPIIESTHVEEEGGRGCPRKES